MNTALNLRNQALENIKNYCEKHNENFDEVKNELIRQADECNLKLPVDFYLSFYNLTTRLTDES